MLAATVAAIAAPHKEMGAHQAIEQLRAGHAVDGPEPLRLRDGEAQAGHLGELVPDLAQLRVVSDGVVHVGVGVRGHVVFLLGWPALFIALKRPGDQAKSPVRFTRRGLQSADMKRHISIATALVTLVLALGLGSFRLERRAAAATAGVQAPRFEVDPLWPRPLPNKWILGQ